MVEKVKRPFKNNRRFNRFLNSLQLNLTRNSGYYALVSSLMCLCLIGLRNNSEYQNHDEIDSELHYNFHNWEPKVYNHHMKFSYSRLLITLFRYCHKETHGNSTARTGELFLEFFKKESNSKKRLNALNAIAKYRIV